MRDTPRGGATGGGCSPPTEALCPLLWGRAPRGREEILLEGKGKIWGEYVGNTCPIDCPTALEAPQPSVDVQNTSQ